MNIILSELDAMYGAGIASGNLADSYIMDWSIEPFIKGTYSYPKIGDAGAREIISQNVSEKLFFAGEATCTNGHFATLHGAMETGYKAVMEIFNSVKK